MSISSLPIELFDSIIAIATHIRSQERALRLRLVSRAWNAGVERAAFACEGDYIYWYSGRIVDDVDGFGFLKRYFAYMALHKIHKRNSIFSIDLAGVWQLATDIVEMRKRKVDESQARDMALECAEKIIQGITFFDGQRVQQRWHTCKVLSGSSWFIRSAGALDSALLAATACTGDLDAARRIPLPRSNDIDTTATGIPIETLALGIDPYAVAAYNGDTEFISYLLANESETSNRSKSCRATIIDYAAWGNHLDLINLALGPSFDTGSPDFGGFQESVVSALWRTTRVDVFKRCFELVQDHLNRAAYPSTEDFLSKRLLIAARQGAVALMKYLVDLGASVDGAPPGDVGYPPYWGSWDIRSKGPFPYFEHDGYTRGKTDGFSAPISVAAFMGHEEAVRWLLEKGAKKHGALKAAVMHGSYRIARLLLDNGVIQEDGYQRAQGALLEAVVRENEALFWLLVKYGVRLDEGVKWTFKHEPLESMEKLVEEHPYVLEGTQAEGSWRKPLEPVRRSILASSKGTRIFSLIPGPMKKYM
ncbi:ankyrin [Nemania serpens]|nr:ankyrin [Nemania serpens]